jgi:hypothetical protein
MPLILGFLEHALVEMKPRQLAVEEAAWPEGGYSWTRLRMLDLLLQSHL